MPLGIKSRDYLLKHQRQIDFDVGYLVPGKYQEIQLFFFYEYGVKDLILYLEQRFVAWRVWVAPGREAGRRHMHTYLLEPHTSNTV